MEFTNIAIFDQQAYIQTLFDKVGSFMKTSNLDFDILITRDISN